MDIVHVAAEMAPFAKVGGLGDVLHGLSKAQVKQGHRVRVFLPKYDVIDFGALADLQVLEAQILIQEKQVSISNTLWSAKYDGIDLILVETHHPKEYFERGRIYGEKDDSQRFIFFSKVVSTYLERETSDIVHLHDWHTAACALFLEKKRTNIYTIHNMEYQGECSPSDLRDLGLAFEDAEICDPANTDQLNLLRAAIKKSQAITTVSPTYMQEILTPDCGCGLHKELQKNKKKLHGILNGIDTDYWNPETDPLLIEKYNLQNHEAAKKINKAHIQKHLNLPPSPAPLIACITRLVPQKGPDLIHFGIEKTLELGGQFVLLGSCASEETKKEFELFTSNPNVHLHFDLDEPLAHLLYAGADFVLMPSIFEPCGLTQMIALRYGTVPLVRATGGLKDTVIDGENGFTFDPPDNRGVSEVLEKGFKSFQSTDFQKLIEKGMQADLSWEASASAYLTLYQKLIKTV